jgi:hypothetical protein
MKTGFLFFFIGLLFVFAASNAQEVSMQEIAKESYVKGEDLDVKILGVSKSTSFWVVDVEIVNKSESSFFILADPRTASGKYIAYVSSSENDSTLDLTVRFFKGPDYFLYVNATRAKLAELKQHTNRFEKYILPIPLHRTLPPYGDKPSESAKIINLGEVKNIRFSIGVLPDDDGIRELLVPQKSNPFFDGYFTGGETIENGALKGKNLLGVQTIFSSTYKIPGN